MFAERVELLVAKEDALFNDLPLQMTRAASPGKERELKWGSYLA
jgi:hypothetical protein